MRQLAVITSSNVWPGSWDMPEFEVHHCASLSQLEPELRFDGVALVQPRLEDVELMLQALAERDRLGTVATLLAGRADAVELQVLLDRHPFDGFIDLAWPGRVAAASIRMVLSHLELGRNLVDIQRVVIQQARTQMTSLYELAVHDGLTNLFNHRYFTELMERRHERSTRMSEAYALVFIDLDDLKQLNTRYGHAGGSQALHELARTIAASIRGSDVAVRLGGDEFAIFLAGCDQAQGTEFAQRLCAKLRAHRFTVDGQELSITVSCGVASYPEDGATYADLLKHADTALLHAKVQGKDRVIGFLPPARPASLAQ